MLTKDLIKPTLRQGKIFPRLLKVTDENVIQLAENILLILQNNLGQSLRDIQESVDQLPSDRFRTRQAFWKILCYKSLWQETDKNHTEEQRWHCFYLATTLRQSKSFQSPQDYREQVAEHFGCREEELRVRIFADLPENQRLVEPAQMTSEALLDHYNLAQIEGLLARAKKIEIEHDGKKEDLLKKTKPAQLLSQLLQVPKFSLEAEIMFGNKAAILRLNEKTLLKARE